MIQRSLFGMQPSLFRCSGTLDLCIRSIASRLRDGSDGWRSPVPQDDSTGGARLRTPSANHRLLGPPTGPEVRDGSFCGQCTRWQVQYSQTGATLRRHFSRAVAAACTFVSVVAATSALCRGTSQRNIASQMFPLLPTLRRHVSRPVAAGVYLSLKDVAASQFVCSRGADHLSSHLSSFGSDLSSSCFGSMSTPLMVAQSSRRLSSTARGFTVLLGRASVGVTSLISSLSFRAELTRQVNGSSQPPSHKSSTLRAHQMVPPGQPRTHVCGARIASVQLQRCEQRERARVLIHGFYFPELVSWL